MMFANTILKMKRGNLSYLYLCIGLLHAVSEHYPDFVGDLEVVYPLSINELIKAKVYEYRI